MGNYVPLGCLCIRPHRAINECQGWRESKVDDTKTTVIARCFTGSAIALLCMCVADAFLAHVSDRVLGDRKQPIEVFHIFISTTFLTGKYDSSNSYDPLDISTRGEFAYD